MHDLFLISSERIEMRMRELSELRKKIRDPDNEDCHDPNPFFFDPILLPDWEPANSRAKIDLDNCVRGYWGTAPIMVVGSEPSKKGEIYSSYQAKEYYRLLHKHGLANAHLTDVSKNIPVKDVWGLRIGLDPEVQKRIFLREVHIIDPSDIICLDSSAYARVRKYLAEPGSKPNTKTVIHTHKMDDHYTWLRVPEVVPRWERNLEDILTGIAGRSEDV